MCGIIGIASKSFNNKDVFFKALSSMKHRGPDSSNVWASKEIKNIFLGHNRLSIIDLTNNSSQPMIDQSGNFVIIFNGEIYNYKSIKAELSKKGIPFKTNGDTEVLLEAYKYWEQNCLEKLVGMFVFAIYDLKKERIFIARDRAGEKPLYYYHNASEFMFSSELKGLMSFPQINRKININSLDIFLAEGYVPGEKCILEGVNKLPAGHHLTLDLKSNKIDLQRYWSLPPLELDSQLSLDDTILTLENLLNNSVKNQLEADVPVGILLSGGLDSSIITALAARNKSKVNTYTIKIDGDKSLDESKHALLIAEHFGTNHFELKAEDSLFDSLPMIAKQFDEPLIDSSSLPTFLVTKLVKEHCTVALGGDGGDELFGGYNHYSRLINLFSISKYLNTDLRKIISKLLISIYKKNKGRNWIKAFGTNLASDLPRLATYFDKNERVKLFNEDSYNNLVAEQDWNLRTVLSNDLIERATKTDFYNYLCEDILVKVDRTSMMNSLETRAPFLDHRVIDFAYKQINSSLKTNSKQRKIILQMLGEKILPKEFDFNRKQGFRIPIDDWFKSRQWCNFTKDVLLDKNQDIFCHSHIKDIISNHMNGDNQGEKLYGLLIFELWRKEYGASL